MGCCKRVLVVDDDMLTRTLCAEALGLKGYEVGCASNGLEAMERLRETDYDLVITDVNMPWLDGLGLYETASEEFPHMKNRFFFMTGGAETGTLSLMRKRVLKKPFMVAELTAMVETIIRRKAS